MKLNANSAHSQHEMMQKNLLTEQSTLYILHTSTNLFVYSFPEYSKQKANGNRRLHVGANFLNVSKQLASFFSLDDWDPYKAQYNQEYHKNSAQM